jgi:hypothetical protein
MGAGVGPTQADVMQPAVVPQGDDPTLPLPMMLLEVVDRASVNA